MGCFTNIVAYGAADVILNGPNLYYPTATPISNMINNMVTQHTIQNLKSKSIFTTIINNMINYCRLNSINNMISFIFDTG